MSTQLAEQIPTNSLSPEEGGIPSGSSVAPEAVAAGALGRLGGTCSYRRTALYETTSKNSAWRRALHATGTVGLS